MQRSLFSVLGWQLMSKFSLTIYLEMLLDLIWSFFSFTANVYLRSSFSQWFGCLLWHSRSFYTDWKYQDVETDCSKKHCLGPPLLDSCLTDEIVKQEELWFRHTLNLLQTRWTCFLSIRNCTEGVQTSVTEYILKESFHTGGQRRKTDVTVTRPPHLLICLTFCQWS